MNKENTFNGKAIYSPSGKAGEYSYWACNFYVGCSNGCTYCYCKKGIVAKQLGGDHPTLKKCFKHESHAMEVFTNEMEQNIEMLREHGIFFSFTTDPMLPETIDLTWDAVGRAVYNKIPVKILTKCTQWVNDWLEDAENYEGGYENPELYAFGFTLTDHDELEPWASTNTERLASMHKLHMAGFKTFASIEPIIDFDSSMRMIDAIYGICDLIKIGLMSGKKYDKRELIRFLRLSMISVKYPAKIYFKDSLLKQAGIERESLPDNCVTRDYNMFEK